MGVLNILERFAITTCVKNHVAIFVIYHLDVVTCILTFFVLHLKLIISQLDESRVLRSFLLSRVKLLRKEIFWLNFMTCTNTNVSRTSLLSVKLKYKTYFFTTEDVLI